MHYPLMLAAAAAVTLGLTAVTQAQTYSPRAAHSTVRHHAVSQEVVQTGRSVYLVPQPYHLVPDLQRHWGF